MKTLDIINLFQIMDGMKIGDMSSASAVAFVRSLTRIGEIYERYHKECQKIAAALSTDNIKDLAKKREENSLTPEERAILDKIEADYSQHNNSLLERDEDIRLEMLDEADLYALMKANPDLPAGQFARLTRFLLAPPKSNVTLPPKPSGRHTSKPESK
jgi:hypothetical protein